MACFALVEPERPAPPAPIAAPRRSIPEPEPEIIHHREPLPEPRVIEEEPVPAYSPQQTPPEVRREEREEEVPSYSPRHTPPPTELMRDSGGPDSIGAAIYEEEEPGLVERGEPPSWQQETDHITVTRHRREVEIDFGEPVSPVRAAAAFDEGSPERDQLLETMAEQLGEWDRRQPYPAEQFEHVVSSEGRINCEADC